MPPLPRQLLRKPTANLVLLSISHTSLPPRPQSQPHLCQFQKCKQQIRTTFLQPRRYQSTSSHTRNAHTLQSPTQQKLNTLLARLPRFLHPYTAALRTAPISHVISFLILHELTAIVPLVGLAGLFHWLGWVPAFDLSWGRAGESEGGDDGKAKEGGYIAEGIERWGRYFNRKGWFGFGAEGQDIQSNGQGDIVLHEGGIDSTDDAALIKAEERWNVGERGGRILVEVATAYAITKVLLPARILVSVWGTPWFARVFVGRFGGLLGRGGGKTVAANVTESGARAAAVGTGSTAGSAVGKGTKSLADSSMPGRQ